MKKCIATLFVAGCVAAFECTAQRRAEVDISAGGGQQLVDSWPPALISPGIPVDPYLGWAKIGACVNASLRYRIFHGLGLLAMIRWQSNSIDDAGLTNLLRHYSSADWNVTSKPWTRLDILFGAFYSLPSRGKITVAPHVLTGIGKITPPEIVEAFNTNHNGLYISGQSKWDATSRPGPVVLAGLRVKYNAGKKLGVLMSFDFSYTWYVTKINLSTEPFGTNTRTETLQRMVTGNISAGLSWRL